MFDRYLFLPFIFNHENSNLNKLGKAQISDETLITGQLVIFSTAGFTEPTEHNVKQSILSKNSHSYIVIIKPGIIEHENKFNGSFVNI